MAIHTVDISFKRSYDDPNPKIHSNPEIMPQQLYIKGVPIGPLSKAHEPSSEQHQMSPIIHLKKDNNGQFYVAKMYLNTAVEQNVQVI